ncbi:MAG TPA: aminoacyl-tRNA hydrolase [Actinomycetota bacterium]|nr:aminoacyl-tRNA hydrolase [Actinomycetota bacterium]
MAWLVAGLGNPGDRYANTRHNVGRMVVDELAADAAERFRKVRFMPSEVAEIREGDERVLLVRSTLYMNESGPSFAGIAKKQGIDADHLIAVHDEIEIPAGELRIKLGGGTAGHNGLRSLSSALRTPDFYRVRAGVGRPPGRRDPSDYVLAPIAKRDETDVAILVGRGADAVRSLILDGLTATQDRFNRAAGGA